MSAKRRWTRRQFFRATTLGGGALVLGFYIAPVVSRNRRQRAIRDAAEATGEFRPNAWLVIQPDNTIVFTLDRVEMGQGTMTSHPMLIAEELEVDPKAIKVEFADADRRFDHPEFFLQFTGGSSSVRASWELLRRAGAVAREMLRAAGAKQWGVPIDECIAQQAEIVHQPTGWRQTYGSLTRLAAQMPIPTPPLKRPSRLHADRHLSQPTRCVHEVRWLCDLRDRRRRARYGHSRGDPSDVSRRNRQILRCN